jgi:hypothetical protein
LTFGLKPWACRPFELIFHAELHYRRGIDYDRRLALISFDNSIEISITTYLSLNPVQRGHRQYQRADVQRWMNNYHTKLDFFAEEIQRRGLPEYVGNDEIIWYHDHRNDQYHGSGHGVPEISTLEGIRKAALWIFSVLFETADIEDKLELAISQYGGGLPSIPEGFAVPRKPEVPEVRNDPSQMSALTAASLLGGWDENNESDLEVVNRVVNGL